MKFTKKSLATFLAQIASYAQEHVSDPEAWSNNPQIREQYLGCTSYTVACFLSQNTVDGHYGVGCDIILPKLVDNALYGSFMCKPEHEWESIMEGLIDDLGGVKSNT